MAALSRSTTDLARWLDDASAPLQTFKKFGENPVAFILEGYKTYGNCFTLPVFGLYNFTFMLGGYTGWRPCSCVWWSIRCRPCSA